MYGQRSDKLKLTAERRQILQDLVIDQSQPGTILPDFRVMLDTFRNSKQALTPGHQLPRHLLAEINQQLSHPVQLALKRPQQKSYPHIQGLYLLLRAFGLSYVDVSGKQPVLVIDDEAYQQWEHLNATERYCSLLEAWFLRGYAEIIDEFNRPSWALPDNFYSVMDFIERHDLDAGLQVAENHDAEISLHYVPGRHNLGLLELFGFISVQSGLPQPGEGWHIERIRLTPVGAAFLSLLYTEFFEKYFFSFDIEGDVSSTESLQNILQPYFPEWQHDLRVPKATFRDGTYIFKVTLGDLWRRIAIDAKQTLAVLASAILESVDFDEDHLYEFSYRNRFGILEQIYHWYMEESPSAPEVMIGDLSLRIGQTMTFLFDFGDNWEFDLLLEAIEPDRVIAKVEILETYGEAPEQYLYEDDDDDFEKYDDE